MIFNTCIFFKHKKFCIPLHTDGDIWSRIFQHRSSSWSYWQACTQTDIHKLKHTYNKTYIHMHACSQTWLLSESLQFNVIQCNSNCHFKLNVIQNVIIKCNFKMSFQFKIVSVYIYSFKANCIDVFFVESYSMPLCYWRHAIIDNWPESFHEVELF